MERPSSRSSPPISVRATLGATLQFRRLLRGAPKVTLEEHGAYTSSLRLEGTFKPGFVGSLAAGLAEYGVSIVRGFAEANAFGEWEAELMIVRAPAGAMPSKEELIRLADR